MDPLIVARCFTDTSLVGNRSYGRIASPVESALSGMRLAGQGHAAHPTDSAWGQALPTTGRTETAQSPSHPLGKVPTRALLLSLSLVKKKSVTTEPYPVSCAYPALAVAKHSLLALLVLFSLAAPARHLLLEDTTTT
jgi:hypothetical protein